MVDESSGLGCIWNAFWGVDKIPDAFIQAEDKSNTGEP
jgi:hypothetical protein